MIPALSLADVPQSRPQPLPLPEALPAARDIPYPGAMLLHVDATDVRRGIFRVSQKIPVAADGGLTLLYPQWLPGHHAPRGPIDDVTGLRFEADGKALTWHRDPANVYAIHVDVPAGARLIEARFEYVSPTLPAQGRVVMTSEILNLQWNLVSFYPAGYFTRGITVESSVSLPVGWRFGTALEQQATSPENRIAFRPTDYDTLVDSPIFAGRHYRMEQLATGVRLHIVADSAAELEATPAQIEAHRMLVRQALGVFGVRHFDRYEFLLSISDRLGGIGLEHHRSSENGVSPGYFTKWAEQSGRRSLLPHEFSHSWNGKFRRGADLFTPDFSTPMRNSMLWVYEGQTQYWGYVLQARSGLVSVDDTLSALAMIAAQLDARPGRAWRALNDTTFDPISAARRPQPWLSWQRSEDYYNEGMLIWLDTDMKLRELTAGQRSLDDFARLFFGGTEGDFGIATYDFDTVTETLRKVVPFDWATFLKTRVELPQPRAPLDWIETGGYQLRFDSTPTPYWGREEARHRINDLSYSLGLVIDRENSLSQVIWDSPAFVAGLTVGTVVLAVNEKAYDADGLRAAIADAAKTRNPINLLVKQGDQYRTVSLVYNGGLRYPRLVKLRNGPQWLDQLLAPKRLP